MRAIAIGFIALVAFNSHTAEVVNRETGKKFESTTGETVYELAGKAVGNATKHSVALVELTPHGGESSKHFHQETEESYYVIAGEGLLTLNGKQKIIKEGDLVVISVNTVHHIINKGTQTLKLLVTAAGPWQHSDMFIVKE